MKSGIITAATSALLFSGVGNAAEIKVLSTQATEQTYRELGACPSNSGFCWPKKRESDSLPPHEQDIPRLEDR